VTAQKPVVIAAITAVLFYLGLVPKPARSVRHPGAGRSADDRRGVLDGNLEYSLKLGFAWSVALFRRACARDPQSAAAGGKRPTAAPSGAVHGGPAPEHDDGGANDSDTSAKRGGGAQLAWLA